MAHECPDCNRICWCSGDIDDYETDAPPGCDHCAEEVHEEQNDG